MTEWEYDNRGRTTIVTDTIPGLSDGGIGTGKRTFHYAYDSADRQTSITYPTSPANSTAEVVSYTYDAGWRQAKACTSLGGCYGQSAQYTALDQPSSISFGNALTQTYTYDNPMQRLSRMQVSGTGGANNLFDRSYLYDPVGNVSTITNTLASPTSEAQSFGYDERDRLTSWGVTGGPNPTSQSYAYDLIGNITSKAGITYTYGLGNGGPYAVRSTSAGNSYTYDGNGNMLTGAGRDFTWNAENQPTSIISGTVNGGVTENYTYDADDTRVKREVVGGDHPGTSYYVQGLYEEDSTIGKTRNLYTFNGQVIAQNEWLLDGVCTNHELAVCNPCDGLHLEQPTQPKQPQQTKRPQQERAEREDRGDKADAGTSSATGNLVKSVNVVNPVNRISPDQIDADPSVLTITLNDRIDFYLNVNLASNISATSQQAYLTFNNSLLQNVKASNLTGCTITNTVTADTSHFDAVLQNEVCNGPNPCTFRNITVSPGSMAFASGGLTNCTDGCTGNFHVAHVAFCAIAPGQAVVHWQFSPPDPSTRDTQIADANGNQAVRECYQDVVINIVGPSPTPTNTPILTNTPTYTRTPTRTNTPPSTPTPTSCNCQAIIVPNNSSYLHEIDNGTRAQVTLQNTSSCSQLVGVASYDEFDEPIEHQELHDWVEYTLAPSEIVTLSVALPTYAYQADAFCGHHIDSFLCGVTYSGEGRLKSDLHNDPDNYPYRSWCPSKKLVGHVTWQGRSTQPNNLQQLPITLTLKSGTLEKSYPCLTTDTYGFFTVPVYSLVSGTYSWRVKGPSGSSIPNPGKPGFLATSGTVSLSGASTTQQEMGLI
jgi:hypothetical protein